MGTRAGFTTISDKFQVYTSYTQSVHWHATRLYHFFLGFMYRNGIAGASIIDDDPIDFESSLSVCIATASIVITTEFQEHHAISDESLYLVGERKIFLR